MRFLLLKDMETKRWKRLLPFPGVPDAMPAPGPPCIHLEPRFVVVQWLAPFIFA
jgi:hypothetical protein